MFSMSQYGWTFYNPIGGTQNLGLYHGDNSGHVMVYLNHKVVIVDFKVYESKSYSLILNEELIKINLNQSNGKFSYHLERTPQITSHNPMERMKKFFGFPFS
jgi:hypothetical protein